uniref:Uncharacterized protein n=1 Tax=Amorphochlora amoebiformis TaxID=1561963 RepID=A0A7S0H113_9EUKA|mmetsp:Transcript_33542/g.53967  ORF Transcript_33542/g.53967 Transcript_33542/m.53967 type:complete len:183 (+) Transcript_33542:57-605(+)
MRGDCVGLVCAFVFWFCVCCVCCCHRLFSDCGVLCVEKRMAALGLGCLLSYGFVSNINVGVITAVAWASFSKQTGLSPLAEGQWLKFVAVQVGIYAVVGNLLRPVRLALAVSVAPMFNKAIAFLQNKLQVSKGLAVFLNVVLFNVIINISFMCTGIWIASKLVGVPAIPPGRLPEWVPSWVT